MQKIIRSGIVQSVFFTVYFAGGIYTLVQQLLLLPFPLSIFMDYGFYHQALNRALTGGDMYAVREIGPAFLYPPPALLFVDVLNLLPGQTLQGSLFAALNMLMLAVMIRQVCKKYRLETRLTVLLIAAGLGFAPFLLTLEMGQVNMLTQFGLGLLLIFATDLPWLAGVGLAAAVMTKVTPVFFFAYLLATRNFRALMWTILSLAGFGLAAGLRYGFQSFSTYLEVFREMTHILPVGSHSQSVGALLATHGLGDLSGPGQFSVTFCMALVILVSAWITFRGGKPEATFIITGLAMMLSPNILWYHHYVFFILPFILWIAWQKENPFVLAWCLACMLVLQLDYFQLTGGVLAHLAGYVSILLVLSQSAAGSRRAARPEPA